MSTVQKGRTLMNNCTPPLSDSIREDDLQQHIEDDTKVTLFTDGKRIEVSLNELPETVRRTAYAVLVSSGEF